LHELGARVLTSEYIFETIVCADWWWWMDE
jgi:hypothetical protein